MKKLCFIISFITALLTSTTSLKAQFTSGVIPMCDTSDFTWYNNYGNTIIPYPNLGYNRFQVLLNITSNHPQTLKIILTSPAGTSLVLSEFNGAGGSNYTSTCFLADLSNPIISTGSAPFWGNWQPQGAGGFSVFAGENSGGTWHITVIDTACSLVNSNGIPNGWTSGFFSCDPIDFTNVISVTDMPIMSVNICDGEALNLEDVAIATYGYDCGFDGWPLVTTGGYYISQVVGMPFDLYIYTIHVTVSPKPALGPDIYINQCTSNYINLDSIVNNSLLIKQWEYNGSTISSATASSVANSGNYQLIGTNPSGCSDTINFIVNISSGLSIGSDQTDSICQGQPVNLDSLYNTTGLIANWYYNNSVVLNTLAITIPGEYSLVASNSAGCIDTAIFTLSNKTVNFLGTDISKNICDGTTTDLTTNFDTTGSISTAWYFGSNQILIPSAVSSLGQYALIANYPDGCIDTAYVNLNIIQNPALGNDQLVSYCYGSSIDLNTVYNIGANSAEWFIGGMPINNVSTVSSNGLYSIVVTNSLGCTDTANITVSSAVKPNLGNDLSLNVCSNVTEDLTSYFITSTYNVTWLLNGNPVANPTSVNNTGNYTLYVSDVNGCKDTAEINITQLSSPQLGNDLNESICSDSSIDLNALVNTTNLSGNWTNNSSIVTNTANVNTSGTYNLVATNTNGCNDTVNVNLTVNTIPNPGPSQTLSICEGQSMNLNNYFNTGNDTALWISNGQVILDVTAVQDSGTYNLQLTNSNGCKANTYASVTILPKPEIGPWQTLSICSGSSIDLTNQFSITGLTSSWEYNSNAISDPINADQPGNYQVISTNIFGCSDTAQVNLTVNYNPDLGPDLSYSLCQWQSLDLSALVNLSGVTTQYYYNGNTISNYNAVSDSGDYQIIATNASGCVDTLNIGYEQIECICAADFRTNSNCVEDIIQFQVIADSTIMNSHWQFTNSPINESYETNPLIKFSTSNDIKVTLAIELSCGTDTITKTISLENCAEKCKTYIPQAFSPNNDGHNDQYQIIFNCQPETYSFKIINRFGQEIFSSNDYKEQWDGNYKGTSPQNGIYTYKLEYKLPYQDKEIKIGTFMIIK